MSAKWLTRAHANAGRHDAIIAEETFDAVQRQPKDNAPARRSATNDKTPSLLAAFDDTGDRLCPTHASKKWRRYRYCISKRLMHRTGATDGEAGRP
jgi:site-specific DNA recombinase